MKSVLAIVVLIVAAVVPSQGRGQGENPPSPTSAEQEVLRTEREQRDAYLRRDVAATERLVADDFIQVVPDGYGTKATLIEFVRREPADPTLTLTSEDTRVRIVGDTAFVTGRRVERRRRPDTNQEGASYARSARTYVRRGGRWQLQAEYLQAIPAPRTPARVDPKVYGDYVGRYDSPAFSLNVTNEGGRLMAERVGTFRQPKTELLPESESEFFIEGRNVQVIFLRDRAGRVTHARLYVNGADIRADRAK